MGWLIGAFIRLKMFSIIPEFRVLKADFLESQPQNTEFRIRQIIIASGYLKTADHLNSILLILGKLKQFLQFIIRLSARQYVTLISDWT